MPQNKTLTKSDLVALVAKDLDLTKKNVEDVLNTTFNSIKQILANGDKLNIIGLLGFSVSKRAARKGRNPKTGKEIAIPAKNVVKVKVGKALQESVE